jgi:hypothetical protein
MTNQNTNSDYAHAELTIRRPNGEIEVVALHPAKFPVMTDTLFARMKKANLDAGRGECLSYRNVAVAPKTEVKLTTSGWGEHAITWYGDLTRADADILAECRQVLAKAVDADEQMTDEQIIAKINDARTLPERRAAAEVERAAYDASRAAIAAAINAATDRGDENHAAVAASRGHGCAGPQWLTCEDLRAVLEESEDWVIVDDEIVLADIISDALDLGVDADSVKEWTVLTRHASSYIAVWQY